MMCTFSKKKVHSLSVAPEPLAIWNKELEGLESKLFKGLKTSPVVALEHYSKRTWIQDLGIFSGSLLLSDVVVWWWLSVNAFCSRVVLCRYILPNMPVFEYCSLSPESSIIESCLFTVSFVSLILLVLLVHVHRFFGL